MKGKKYNTFAGYTTGYINQTPKKMYSTPKLFVAKKKIDGKMVPSVDSGAKWYVYFYFKDPSEVVRE